MPNRTLSIVAATAFAAAMSSLVTIPVSLLYLSVPPACRWRDWLSREWGRSAFQNFSGPSDQQRRVDRGRLPRSHG